MHKSNKVLITLVIATGTLSACSDAGPANLDNGPAVPISGPTRYTMDDNVDGCGTAQDPCTVGGLVVSVTVKAPVPYDPPPPPPQEVTPAYTTPSGGWGAPTRGPSGEVQPPALGGEYADGPIAYVTCVAVASGLAYLQQTPGVVKAAENVHYAIDRLNTAEVEFQMIRANQNRVGEETYIQYQNARDNAQTAYNDAARALHREIQTQKAVTWGAFALSMAGCVKLWWVPWL